MIVKCGEEVYLLTRRLMFRHDNGDTTALRILHITLRLDHIGRRAPPSNGFSDSAMVGIALRGTEHGRMQKGDDSKTDKRLFPLGTPRIFCQALIKLYLLLGTGFLLHRPL